MNPTPTYKDKVLNWHAEIHEASFLVSTGEIEKAQLLLTKIETEMHELPPESDAVAFGEWKRWSVHFNSQEEYDAWLIYEFNRKKGEYPFNGFAPGHYNCKCGKCGNQFRGDKMAVRCEHCAIAIRQQANMVDVHSVLISCRTILSSAGHDQLYPSLLEQIQSAINKTSKPVSINTVRSAVDILKEHTDIDDGIVSTYDYNVLEAMQAYADQFQTTQPVAPSLSDEDAKVEAEKLYPTPDAEDYENKVEWENDCITNRIRQAVHIAARKMPPVKDLKWLADTIIRYDEMNKTIEGEAGFYAYKQCWFNLFGKEWNKETYLKSLTINTNNQ